MPHIQGGRKTLMKEMEDIKKIKWQFIEMKNRTSQNLKTQEA